MLSINGEIRKAINKKGGDMVLVTLYLISKKMQIKETQILETFKEANVLKAFKKLNDAMQTKIFEEIISEKNEEKQIKIIIKHIDTLS